MKRISRRNFLKVAGVGVPLHWAWPPAAVLPALLHPARHLLLLLLPQQRT